MKITFNILALILFIFSIMPLIKGEAWWIRIFDFPRVQVAVASFIVLGLMLLFIKSWNSTSIVAASALGIALILELVQIFPYTPVAYNMTKDVEPGFDKNAAISIMISNVRMSNRETQKLVTEVNRVQPDVLLVIEPDDYWEQQLRQIEETFPHTLKQPLENTYGMMVYSKLEMQEKIVNYLFTDSVPSMEFTLQLRNNKKVKLYCLHPMPPQPGVDTKERDAELIIIGKKAKEQDLPAIIAGDMNDVAWSHTTRLFMRTSNVMDPRKGRGMYNTYNANIPFFRWPLDHLFHTDDFRLVKIERLEHIGSDHFPVLVELVLQPQKDNGKAPEPENGDEEEAGNKVRKAEED